MVLKLFLLFALSMMYVECIFIAEDGILYPVNAQFYNGEENFGPSRLTRQNIGYTKSAGVQSDQTVIVVPNQGMGTVSRQQYGYSTYGSSASKGPTVIVNVPDEYHRVATDPYRRY